jgi:UDP-glucose 4-epimerase
MSADRLTVAVTGPTGEIGAPFMDALERTPEVARVVAMGRRPFDPAARGWAKAEYRQGDILDHDAVERLVAGADAVVHLAFIVVKATADSYGVNVQGSRNVFEATVAAGAPRLVYTSSVAAYGYHRDVDGPLREDMPPRGTEAHAYSHQKAAVEAVLDEALDGGEGSAAYVFRPCVVAGPQAPALLDQLPYLQLSERLPDALLRALARLPGAKPLLPDHGIPFQLVHHDDVAAALVAAVLGRGEPGTYNLAADGTVSVSDLASALGWHSVPVPKAAVDVAAGALARLPGLEVQAGWLEALRTSMVMDTTRARERLGWRPEYDARGTLEALVAPRRAATRE